MHRRTSVVMAVVAVVVVVVVFAVVVAGVVAVVVALIVGLAGMLQMEKLQMIMEKGDCRILAQAQGMIMFLVNTEASLLYKR